jgi:excisionase family DNA binding protein
VTLDFDQPQLTVPVPDWLVQAVAERTAQVVLAQLDAVVRVESPWLDFEAAMAYLRFSRDRLYKLTAARAIPFRKKQDGQRLLFHRGELDHWLEQEYVATGWMPEIELTSHSHQHGGGSH